MTHVRVVLTFSLSLQRWIRLDSVMHYSGDKLIQSIIKEYSGGREAWQKGGLKNFPSWKGGFLYQRVGGELIFREAWQRGGLKNFPSWKGGFLYQRVGGELIFILKGCLMYQSIPNPPMSPRHTLGIWLEFCSVKRGIQPKPPNRAFDFCVKTLVCITSKRIMQFLRNAFILHLRAFEKVCKMHTCQLS